MQRGRCRWCFWSARYRLNRVRHFVHSQLGTVGDQAIASHQQENQQDAGKSARRHRTHDGVLSGVGGIHSGEDTQFADVTTTSRSNFPERLELPRGRTDRTAGVDDESRSTTLRRSYGLGAMRHVLSYIPSPNQNVIQLGASQLRAYGLMLALGVLAATKIATVRWKRRGGAPKVIGEIVVPVVIGGVIGARIYHLFTGYKWSRDGVAAAFEIWRGGLSIWGAVAGGLLALVVLARVKHLDVLALADAIAPGVAIAQAIGRWGNWFNQELFGRPTRLPWALEIDRAHRPRGYARYTTFHPTFLYESLWCLIVFATIIVVERRFAVRRGQAFALYIAMYTFGRAWFEALRIDDASRLFGVRFNLLLSIVLCIASSAWFAWLAREGGYPSSRRASRRALGQP